jgi:predicted flap endonuclease-1-like 5' DNA nuclease
MQDRSSRTFVVVMLLLGALMTALWLLVREQPVQEWWLPLLLLLLAGLIGWWPGRQAASEQTQDEGAAPALPAPQQPRVREFLASEVRTHAHAAPDIIAAPALTADASAEVVEAPPEPTAEPIAEPEPAYPAEPVAEPETAAAAEPSIELVGTAPDVISSEAAVKPSEAPLAAEAEPAVTAAFAAQETAAESAAVPPPVELQPAPEPEAAKPKPKRSRAAADVDDLKRVEGIGPKMEKALHAADIKTFARLAEASEDELRAAIEAQGLRFAPSLPTWARQAAYLASGDEVGFEAYKEKLIAGREAD